MRNKSLIKWNELPVNQQVLHKPQFVSTTRKAWGSSHIVWEIQLGNSEALSDFKIL